MTAISPLLNPRVQASQVSLGEIASSPDKVKNLVCTIVRREKPHQPDYFEGLSRVVALTWAFYKLAKEDTQHDSKFRVACPID